jgi:hypothetical protein
MGTVRVTLTGTTPLILHNGRLANPLDPNTRALKALTGKRSKTDDDLAAMIEVEARGAVYETTDDEVGLPDANVWRAIQEAAKAYKRGQDVSRAVIYDPEHISPLLIDGTAASVDDFLRDPANIDYRPVGINGRTVMRARPIIHGWSSSHEFEVYTDIVMVDDLVMFVERAGRLQAVGDHRPQYGRFTATVETL